MDFPIAVIATAQDRASATLARVEQHTSRLDRAFGGLANRIKTGIQWHILNNGLNLIDRAVRHLVDAIPDLIHRGEQWSRVVDEIGDVTGLTARKASELAAVQSYLTDGTDSLGRALIILAKNAVTNKDAFDQLGIATRDSRGHLLDVYDIITNIRGRIGETGQGLLSTAAATKVFGRGAHDLLDLLSLSNRQWRMYADQARRSGLILTEAGQAAADQWTRTQRILDGAITGIGAQILQGAAPALIGLTNAVTQAIQTNMASIVNFVSGAIQVIATVLSNLFGWDIDNLQQLGAGGGGGGGRGGKGLRLGDFKTPSAGGGGGGSGGSGTDRAAAAKQEATEQRALAKALRELAAARAETIFGPGMSQADFVLAQQARKARIKDAEERVADARKAMKDHADAMGKMSAATGAATAKMGRDFAGVLGRGGKIGTSVTEGLAQTLEDSKAFGLQIADAIKDAILGPDTKVQFGNWSVEVRSGGLLDKLSGLADGIGRLVGLIPGNTDALAGVATAIVAWRVINKLPGGTVPLGPPSPAMLAVGASLGLNALLDRILPMRNVHSETLRRPLGNSGLLPGWADPAEISSRLAAAVSDFLTGMFPGSAPTRSVKLGTPGQPNRAPNWWYHQPDPLLDPYRDAMQPRPSASPFALASMSSMVGIYAREIAKFLTPWSPGLGGGRRSSGSFGSLSLLGAGAAGAGTSGIDDIARAMEDGTRRWLAEGSPVVVGLGDQSSTLSSILSAVQPLAGLLGGTFGNIGARLTAVEKVNAGQTATLSAHGSLLVKNVKTDAWQTIVLKTLWQRVNFIDPGPDFPFPPGEPGMAGARHHGGGRSKGHIVVQLSHAATRDFLGGRAVTTSIMPLTGT